MKSFSLGLFCPRGMAAQTLWNVLKIYLETNERLRGGGVVYTCMLLREPRRGEAKLTMEF